MLLGLQKYDLEVVYKRGVEMYMADTLSRAYLKNKTTQKHEVQDVMNINRSRTCLLYTSPSPRDGLLSRMPSSA